VEDPKKWMPKTVSHVFGSMSEFARFVETNATEASRKNQQHGNPSREAWAGGTYADAQRRAMGEGNPELGKLIERNLSAWNIDSLMSEGCSRWEPSRVGVMPIVPNVVAGIPETMLSQHTVHEAARHPLTVMVDVGVSASVSAAEIAQWGAAVAALVLTLQRARPVELFISDSLGERSGKVTATIPIIRIGSAPFDPAQVGFALADVSLTRRLAFAYKWIHAPDPDIPWAWGLYAESEERTARIAHLSGTELGPNFLFLTGVRSMDQQEVKKDPRAWIEKQLRVYAPHMFEHE
jgi:hypothetical protein